MIEQLIEEQARSVLIKANEATSRAEPIGGSNPNFIPIPVVISTQAKNQVQNGDLSHSNYTALHPGTDTPGDDNEECWRFFSNSAPVLGQVLSDAISS